MALGDLEGGAHGGAGGDTGHDPLLAHQRLGMADGLERFRVAVTAAVFLVVVTPFGVHESWWGVLLAFPAQVLIGLAFAAPIYAFSAGLKDDSVYAR